MRAGRLRCTGRKHAGTTSLIGGRGTADTKPNRLFCSRLKPEKKHPNSLLVPHCVPSQVKCFATSISIVLSCVLSIAFLGMSLSQGFVLGTILVRAHVTHSSMPCPPKLVLFKPTIVVTLACTADHVDREMQSLLVAGACVYQ